MKALFGFFVGLNRLCFALEATKPIVKTIGTYGCAPSSTPISVWRAPMDSNVFASSFAKSGLVRFMLVLHVFCMRNIPQIAKPVVSLDVVDVVNLTKRPTTSHIQPRKTMSHISDVVNAKNDISLGIQVVFYLVSWAQVAISTFQSLKKSSFRVVRNEFFQSLLRQFTIVHAHAVALLCNGLGSDTDRPDRRLVLRHFKA